MYQHRSEPKNSGTKPAPSLRSQTTSVETSQLSVASGVNSRGTYSTLSRAISALFLVNTLKRSRSLQGTLRNFQVLSLPPINVHSCLVASSCLSSCIHNCTQAFRKPSSWLGAKASSCCAARATNICIKGLGLQSILGGQVGIPSQDCPHCAPPQRYRHLIVQDAHITCLCQSCIRHMHTFPGPVRCSLIP